MPMILFIELFYSHMGEKRSASVHETGYSGLLTGA